MTVKQMQKQKAATRRFSLDLYSAKREKGMTLNEIGAAVGLSGNQVNILLKDPDKMSLHHLRDICNTMSVPPDNFLPAYGFTIEKEI